MQTGLPPMFTIVSWGRAVTTHAATYTSTHDHTVEPEAVMNPITMQILGDQSSPGTCPLKQTVDSTKALSYAADLICMFLLLLLCSRWHKHRVQL